MMVFCDKCKHDFEVKGFKRRELNQIPEKVHQVYFSCPKCKAEYTTYYETERSLELMKENQDLLNKQQRVTEQIRQKIPTVSAGKSRVQIREMFPRAFEELQEQRDANMKAFNAEQQRIKEVLADG